jgi:glutathione S-transferase
VVLRFKTYQVELSHAAQTYCQHVFACSVIQIWIREALKETDIVDCDEVGEEIN